MPCCGRNSDQNVVAVKKGRKCVTFLFSCCMFWFILCVILVTVLVFVGKHLLYNTMESDYQGLMTKPASANVSKIGEINYFRLPDDARPYLYNLTILPFLDKDYFEGFVNISLRITNPKSELFLHSKMHTIFSVDFMFENRKSLQILSVTNNNKYEVLVITTKQKIFPGNYSLAIKYRGVLEKSLGGLYKSSYESGNQSR